MSKNDNKLINRIKDRMILGTLYDQLMLRLRYNDEKTGFLYSVMAGQKHRMLYYRRYKKRYLPECTGDREWEKLPKEINNDTVFVMWLQGIENAPCLVKRCIESQKRAMPEKKFVFLDENNIKELVSLPDFVLRKREKGIITNALFSDIVRLELLKKYGGYWIDSTVLFTDDVLLRDIEDLPLFMFSFYYFGFNPEVMEYNSFFMHSTTNNNVLCLVQKLLYAYIRDHDYISNYYILHIMGSIANDYYRDELQKMPIVSQVDSHVLASYIYDKFDAKKYEILKKRIGIHKLSIKFDEDRLKEKGTFYDVIIGQGKY